MKVKMVETPYGAALVPHEEIDSGVQIKRPTTSFDEAVKKAGAEITGEPSKALTDLDKLVYEAVASICLYHERQRNTPPPFHFTPQEVQAVLSEDITEIPSTKQIKEICESVERLSLVDIATAIYTEGESGDTKIGTETQYLLGTCAMTHNGDTVYRVYETPTLYNEADFKERD